MNDFTAADTRSTSKVSLAHTLTYPQVLNAKEGVMNLQGIMISGPDRKFDDEGMKFRAWQKAVQHASLTIGAVPADVMSYFQKTKHLSRPPKTGDLNILQSGPIEDALIIHPDVLKDLEQTYPESDLGRFVPVEKIPPLDIVSPGLTILSPEPETLMSFTPPAGFKPPRFTWSYTSLNEFLTCPAQWAAKRFYKTIVDVPGEAMRIGNLIHETAEHYGKKMIGVTYKESSIHSQYLPAVQKYVDALVASGAELHFEKEMCFTKAFKPCGWKDWNEVYVRSKSDVLAKKGVRLSIVDWKTGKYKEDFLQLKMFAVFAALTPGFEDVQEFDPKFIFTKEAAPKNILRLPAPIQRSELKGVLGEILGVVRRMEAAWESETFPCKKNGLCRNWCNNKECPHCG